MGQLLNVVGDAVSATSATQVLLYIVLALIVYLAYNYVGPPLWKKHNVFREMGVPYVPPLVARLQGDSVLINSKKLVWEVEADQIRKYGKVIGKFDSLAGPTLLVAEPDLLRDVFVKNFNSFYNRRPAQPGTSKLFADSVFFQRDQRWHDIRSLISPTFSSAKMRTMDGLIRDCLKVTQAELDGRFEASKNSTIEIDAKNYFSNFAMDVIGTVFFGVSVDAIRNREHPFVKHSFSVFNPIATWAILLFVTVPIKYIRKKLVEYGVIGMPAGARTYFEDVIPQMISDRREAIAKSTFRRDYLNVLITSSEKAITNQDLTATGTLSESNADDVHVNAGAAEQQEQSKVINQKEQARQVVDLSRKFYKPNAPTALNDDEIAGQCFIFMIAGFETTATTIGFLLHELAVNQPEQDRLREEIQRVLSSNAANQTYLSYDTLAEMRFLDACVTETLRLYPPVTRLERQCAEDCVLSNGLQVKKNLIIGIPTWYIQRSPENFVDPDKFDPDRFFDPERREQIKPYTYMPFGHGPRNCVGMRFALLELKMVVAHVIQNYRIVPTDKTVHPVKLQSRTGGLLRPVNAGSTIGLQKLKA